MAQRALVLEQQVVHLPERALRRRRLGRLGRQLRVRVHVGERQVPPDVAHVGEVARAARARSARPCRSTGTRSRRTRRSVTRASIGPRTWSRSGSTSTARSLSGSAVPSSACSLRRFGSSAVTRKTSHVSSVATTADGEDADLRLLQLLALERERGDQQRDREADPGDGAAAADRRPADRRAQPAAAQPGADEARRRGCRAACRARARARSRASPSSVAARESRSRSSAMPVFASAKIGTIT